MCKIPCQRTRHAGYRTFRRGVDGHARNRHVVAADAADIDDPPTSFHEAERFLNGNKQAPDVDGQHPVDVFQWEVVDQAAAEHRGVVHENIQSPEAFRGRSDRGFYRFRVGAIRANCHTPSPGAFDVLDDAIRVVTRVLRSVAPDEPQAWFDAQMRAALKHTPAAALSSDDLAKLYTNNWLRVFRAV